MAIAKEQHEFVIDFLPNKISYSTIFGIFYPGKRINKPKAYENLSLSTLGAEKNLKGEINIPENSPCFTWINSEQNLVFVLLCRITGELIGISGSRSTNITYGLANEYCDACHTQQNVSQIVQFTFKEGRITLGHRLCKNLECTDYINGIKTPHIVTGYKLTRPSKDDLLLQNLEFWNSVITRLKILN